MDNRDIVDDQGVYQSLASEHWTKYVEASIAIHLNYVPECQGGGDRGYDSRKEVWYSPDNTYVPSFKGQPPPFTGSLPAALEVLEDDFIEGWRIGRYERKGLDQGDHVHLDCSTSSISGHSLEKGCIPLMICTRYLLLREGQKPAANLAHSYGELGWCSLLDVCRFAQDQNDPVPFEVYNTSIGKIRTQYGVGVVSDDDTSFPESAALTYKKSNGQLEWSRYPLHWPVWCKAIQDEGNPMYDIFTQFIG